MAPSMVTQVGEGGGGGEGGNGHPDNFFLQTEQMNNAYKLTNPSLCIADSDVCGPFATFACRIPMFYSCMQS